MTPKAAITALEEGIALAGQRVTLRRVTGTTNQMKHECKTHAIVRDFEPAELVGDTKQGDRKLILSPTDMERRQWPLPVRINDKVAIGTKVYNVMKANPFTMGDTVVRIELQIRG